MRDEYKPPLFGLDLEHADLVNALAKPGADVLGGMTPDNAHLLHMAVGIAGEAGEIIDTVKKAAIYEQTLDRENVIEELGDLEFYLRGLRDALEITREETLEHNLRKLRKRYGERYSNRAAKARADKVAED